jgi:hypothetical protein
MILDGSDSKFTFINRCYFFLVDVMNQDDI